mmetsp:Transcript_7028/g.19922  ORF Transcript_7028/g.19922 Transcript_7028/m.19922 type:complete len:211 (+) Transcript_7028:355-987(+)|eukprot:CAMPEP_0119126696 /NCGR_PEP_ID=MMETSP1310-20130426/5518_1 /TAXON_ID=464262 /ORGANISM="Genus nov. species nov., Strain RCC2339" /LENGTH=210 /DNA_ID=CAMNT_0007116867 /DNA_START=358 /DNA_END=990 /DNA_ORIENTATION=-
MDHFLSFVWKMGMVLVLLGSVYGQGTKPLKCDEKSCPPDEGICCEGNVCVEFNWNLCACDDRNDCSDDMCEVIFACPAEAQCDFNNEMPENTPCMTLDRLNHGICCDRECLVPFPGGCFEKCDDHNTCTDDFCEDPFTCEAECIFEDIVDQISPLNDGSEFLLYCCSGVETYVCNQVEEWGELRDCPPGFVCEEPSGRRPCDQECARIAG